MKPPYEGKIISELVVQVSEPKKETRYIFLEGVCQIRYMHGGKEIKEGTSYHDMYGENTCIPHAIEDAKEKMEYYSIFVESSLIIEVLHTITRSTRRKLHGKPDYCEQYEKIGASEEIQRTIVWTSKDPYTILDPNPLIECPNCNKTTGRVEFDWDDEHKSGYRFWLCPECGYKSEHHQYYDHVIDHMNALMKERNQECQ